MIPSTIEYIYALHHLKCLIYFSISLGCEIHSVSTIMSTGSETLQQFFPATSRPLICNAPMAGATNARMAVAVAKAGGLGASQAANIEKTTHSSFMPYWRRRRLHCVIPRAGKSPATIDPRQAALWYRRLQSTPAHWSRLSHDEVRHLEG
jgi:hypothetical protein